MDIPRCEEGVDLMKRAMRILAVALVFGVLVPVVKAGDDRPIVVVFDVDGARAGLSKAFLRDLADYLSSKLTESRRFAVVPREQLRRCLLVQKRKSHKPHCDESCRIELGRELAAEKTMSTRVMKLGRRCTVTLTVCGVRI